MNSYVLVVESYTPGTYEDNLVIESHSPIAAADQGKGFT
jgi:hypothetical protein